MFKDFKNYIKKNLIKNYGIIIVIRSDFIKLIIYKKRLIFY